MTLFENIVKAQDNLNGVVIKTPLQFSINLSDKYQASVYLKREDLQQVRSYKIRGAYNKISHLEFYSPKDFRAFFDQKSKPAL